MTHERAVKKCNKTIKKLKNKGYTIVVVSWFDSTHYHINFQTPEDVKRMNERIEKIKKYIDTKIKEKE